MRSPVRSKNVFLKRSQNFNRTFSKRLSGCIDLHYVQETYGERTENVLETFPVRYGRDFDT